MSALCLYYHSLIYFSKVLLTLVSNVIPLSPYFFCLPDSYSSSGACCRLHIWTSILANIPSSIMPPSHHTLFLFFLSSWTDLCLLVPGIPSDLLFGDFLKLSYYRETLPSTGQSWVQFDPLQQGTSSCCLCFLFAVAVWKGQMVLIRKLI